MTDIAENSFAIVCDSSCDLSPEMCARMGVSLVSSRILMGGEERLDRNIEVDGFVQELNVAGKRVHVANPGRESFEAAFSDLVEDGATSIVAVLPSTHLLGTYEAALEAARSVDGAQIRVVDTKCVSAQLALVVCSLVLDRAAGLSADEATQKASRLAEAARIHLLLSPKANPDAASVSGRKGTRGLQRSLFALQQRVFERYALSCIGADGNAEVCRRESDAAHLAGILARTMSLYSHEVGPLTCLKIGFGDQHILDVLEKPLDTNEFEAAHVMTLSARPASMVILGTNVAGVAYVPSDLLDPQALEDLLTS